MAKTRIYLSVVLKSPYQSFHKFSSNKCSEFRPTRTRMTDPKLDLRTYSYGFTILTEKERLDGQPSVIRNCSHHLWHSWLTELCGRRSAHDIFWVTDAYLIIHGQYRELYKLTAKITLLTKSLSLSLSLSLSALWELYLRYLKRLNKAGEDNLITCHRRQK